MLLNVIEELINHKKKGLRELISVINRVNLIIR